MYHPRFALVVVLTCVVATPARADRLPLMQGELSWSTRACAAASVELAPRLRVPLLHLYAAANVALRRVCPDAPLPVGVSPSFLGGGVAVAYEWFHRGFVGHVALAIDAGAADVEQLWQAGAHARVDLDYALLYADVRGFGAPAAPLTWSFGMRVRPYIRFLELWLDCDSRDRESCGVGAALRLRLPSTPVQVLAAAKVAFFDVSGIGDIGARAMLSIVVDR